MFSPRKIRYRCFLYYKETIYRSYTHITSTRYSFIDFGLACLKERIFSLAGHYNNNNRMTGFSIFFLFFVFCSILDTVYVRNNDMEIESDVL